MGQSKWNEEKIIQTLREFPKVEDPKSKEELFDQIQNRMGQKQRKSKLLRFMPVFAVACVLTIAAIISPTIMNSTIFDSPNSETSQSDLQNSTKLVPEKDAPIGERAEQAPPAQKAPSASEIGPLAYDDAFTYHAGIVEVPEGKQVITVYYPDQEAMGVIPVSILTDSNKNRVAGILEMLDRISAEELGLSESGLTDVKLSEDTGENAFVVDIKPGSIQGSTGDRIFLATVKGTAYHLGYDHIYFKSNGQDGYDFSHIGNVKTEAVEAPDKGVFSQVSEKGTLFLINGFPLSDVQPETLDEALHWMGKEVDGFGYQATVPKNVYIKKVSDEENKATVEFSDGTKLEDNTKYMVMIESILWTASQFGYEQVEFKGAPIDQIGRYDLNNSLPVLKAPNLVSPGTE